MKLTFFSNFLLHHQTPFCEAMVRLLGDGYRYVATETIPEERIALGYHDYTDAPYAVNAYESPEAKAEALRLGRESDVVIIGSAPDEYIVDRIKEGKLTFRYSERFFKNGKWRILDPRVFLSCYLHHTRYRKKNLYMLCASAYTAPDSRFIFAYPKKTYKWGYFPTIPELDAQNVIKQKNKSKISLFWAGRFIDWKHPEEALTVAKHLKDTGIDFILTMRGTGPLLDCMKAEAKKLGIEDSVVFPGATSPENIQAEMQKSDIFLFTSDRQEGWGAVLNEAFSNCCAVVARRQIGSVPYLIRDGENGLIYDSKKGSSLNACVDKLVSDVALRKGLQAEAYHTMRDVWCADVAAKRLLTLIENLQAGKDSPYPDGPCSKDYH